MKYLCGVLVLALSVVAQTGGVKECGNGQDRDHPCHCTIHVEEVQAKHMADCVKARMDEGDGPGRAQLTCAGSMSGHCAIIEHYGRWEVGEDGEHNNPMPNQCVRACTWGHCRCGDHEVCHTGHQASDDVTEVKSKPKRGKK